MVGGVDPDDADRVAELVLVEGRDDVGPGRLLDPRGDGVLEVEEELVGAESGILTGLAQHLLRAAGDGNTGAAEPDRHWATSMPGLERARPGPKVASPPCLAPEMWK